MRRWLFGTLVLGAVLLVGGWALVVVSGYGGSRVGGSPVVWHVGGLMVYASIPVLLGTGVAIVVVGGCWVLQRGGLRASRR